MINARRDKVRSSIAQKFLAFGASNISERSSLTSGLKSRFIDINDDFFRGGLQKSP